MFELCQIFILKMFLIGLYAYATLEQLFNSSHTRTQRSDANKTFMFVYWLKGEHKLPLHLLWLKNSSPTVP